MTARLSADVAVIGLGATGAAALNQLARRGASVIGIDRYRPPHAFGSSHGETRVTRLVLGEGADYVPLVLRSHEIWRELERETGESLLETVGCLTVRSRGAKATLHGAPDFAGRMAAVADRLGLPLERLDAGELGRRFPLLDLRGDEHGLFDPGGGYLHAERCISAQLGRAERLGARLLVGTRVRRLEQQAEGVRIETEGGEVRVGQAVVCAGPWTGGLLGAPFDKLLRPFRQTLHWFSVDPGRERLAEAMPTFVWVHGDKVSDQIYGFPALPGSGAVKLGSERYDSVVDPDALPRKVGDADRADISAHRSGRLRFLSASPVRSVECLYTVAPDFDFLVDRHPAMTGVLVASPCSGHGFKHSAALGEALAQIAETGASALDLSRFRLRRLQGETG